MGLIFNYFIAYNKACISEYGRNICDKSIDLDAILAIWPVNSISTMFRNIIYVLLKPS